MFKNTRTEIERPLTLKAKRKGNKQRKRDKHKRKGARQNEIG